MTTKYTKDTKEGTQSKMKTSVARLTGTVKWFAEKKGYGFIQRDDGEGDLFVHYSELEGKGYRSLQEGQRVEFEIANGKKGLKAVQVVVLE